MSNFSSLKQKAESLLQKISEGKVFALADLNKKFQIARATYSNDAVIHAVANVVEKLYQKDSNGIMSQAKLDEIYQNLVGLNASGTKFREVFGELLHTDIPKFSLNSSEYVNTMRDGIEPQVELVDQKQASEFDNLFNSAGNDLYNPQLASKAKEKVYLELKSLGFDNNVKLLGGNSNILVFAADFDTNRGQVRVLIPAASSGDEFPNSFVSGEKLKQLTSGNLVQHIKEAYDKSICTGINNQTGIVDMPRVETPSALKAIAKEVEENVAEAAVGYPQQTVRLAKRMLLAELSGMGFKGAQLRVVDSTNDGFICEAVLNSPSGKVSIEVPIEIANNIPLMPSVFAKGDYVNDFTTKNIQTFLTKNANNNVVISRDYDLFSMNKQQLQDYIAKAASNNDFDSCDEALEVVAERFGEDVYKNVVSDYQKVLVKTINVNNSIKQAHDDSDQFVMTPTSIYPIHKKFGKPAHDLIRDDSGEYHLKSTYSARQNSSDEAGAFFSIYPKE